MRLIALIVGMTIDNDVYMAVMIIRLVFPRPVSKLVKNIYRLEENTGRALPVGFLWLVRLLWRTNVAVRH